MSQIKRFEDLIAWQRARMLSREIRSTIRSSKIRNDTSLANQMNRAATSVISNIAEGFERGTLPEFVRFLGIAKGSCGELRSQLYVAADGELLTAQQFRALMVLAISTSQLIGALRLSIQRRLRKSQTVSSIQVSTHGPTRQPFDTERLTPNVDL
jgi:four helix bundle protein